MKKLIKFAADWINGGRRGIGETDDVAWYGDEPYHELTEAQRTQLDHRAHQPLPNSNRFPKGNPGTSKMLEGAPYTKDVIPGMDTSPSVFEASFKTSVDGDFPLQDTVRDVSLGDGSPPAPDNAIADNPKPTTWLHAGDNGIEIVPSPHGQDGGLMAKLIRGYQQVKIMPNLPKDVNKMGSRTAQWNHEDPQEGVLGNPIQQLPQIVQHLLKDHMILLQQIYGIEEPALEQFHMTLHQSGQNTHNPEVQIVANILDPIQPGLDPSVFDNPDNPEPTLKENIAAWTEHIVRKVFEENGYSGHDQWLKLVLTGSLTTLQWTEVSDFDVSLWIDLEEFGDFDRAEIVTMIVDKLDGTIVPGTSHPIQCFVVDVNHIKKMSEIYHPGVRSAWDIEEGRWIVPPEHSRVHDVEHDFPDAYHRALQVAHKMRSLLDYQPDRAKVYWNYLHAQRRKSMKAGRGDFSDANITYKMLANSNLFPKIEEVTGEHIASYRLSTYEDDGIIYYNIKAYNSNEVGNIMKTSSSMHDYELDKLHVDDREVGMFSWVDTGFKAESEGVEVHPDFRRQHIASEMIRLAKTITPNLKASAYRTPDGELFLQSTQLLEGPDEINIVRLEPRYAQSPPGGEPQFVCNACQMPSFVLNEDGICQVCQSAEHEQSNISDEMMTNADEPFNPGNVLETHGGHDHTTNPNHPPEFK